MREPRFSRKEAQFLKIAGASDRTVVIFSYAFLGLFAAFCLYPMALAISISFSDENTVLLKGFKLIPDKLSLDTYHYLFVSAGEKIINSYAMTIFVTVVGTLSALFITAMMAYTLSQPHVRYRNALSLLAYFTAVFSAGIVPWYVVCVSVYHLKNTIWALFVPYLTNVFLLFLLKNYFRSIPATLNESAKIDGANDFCVFINLTIPVSKTAMLTVGFLYALQFWNDWWLPIMLVSNKRLFTLQYHLYSLLTNVQALALDPRISTGIRIKLPSETLKMAVTVITIGPIILLYPFVQRFFVKGIIIGAVKG
jgi:putative aldouronate transport system permease protein